MSECNLDCTPTIVIDNVGKHNPNENGSGDCVHSVECLENNENINNYINEKCKLEIGAVDSESTFSVCDEHANNNVLNESESNLQADKQPSYKENGSGDCVHSVKCLENDENINYVNEKCKLEIGAVDSNSAFSVCDEHSNNIVLNEPESNLQSYKENGSGDYVPSTECLQNESNLNDKNENCNLEIEVIDCERANLVGDGQANSGDLVTPATSDLQGGISPTYVPSEYKLVVPKLDKKELLIPRISSNLQNNAIAIITAALVANHVEFEGSIEVTLSLYCGLFNLYLEFINNPVICHYLLYSGYKVRETSIEEWTSWVALKRKGVSHIVAHYLGENEGNLVRLAWTVMGPLLCLLGHKPNNSNIKYWGSKVLKTMCVATDVPDELIQTLFYPSISFCQGLSKILDKLYEIRRQLFITVYNSASSIPAISGTVCRLVVELLRGTGMLDFILIDHFLLIQNPFSLLLNAVAKHTPELLKAYEKFIEYGTLAPWCAVVASPEDLEVFQHPGVKKVAAIARGLALKKGLTLLENYHPTKETQEIIDTVEKADKLLENMSAHKLRQEKKQEKKPSENV